MGSEALWSSFPVDVDSFLSSRNSAPYGELGGSGRYSDVGGMGRRCWHWCGNYECDGWKRE